ncbi:MAG: hypothetical protein JO257_07475 [Deltaproteobacteria bacterium]|nr:hypothetical protein [Deltaproteobacteria bacterium]
MVTFVDILGFRELVASDKTGEKVLAVFRNLRMYGTEDLGGIGRSRNAKYLHFSDSVVRATPLVHGDGWHSDRETVLHELERLTYAQGELAATGVLLRGGIAAGLAHADATSVFGPAFIDAYTVESQLALFPRIVLHPDLVTEFGSDGARGRAVYADDGLALTRVGSDGLHFLDYLGNFPREVHTDASPDREEVAMSYMEPRKASIEQELVRRHLLDPVRTKYVWLGRYHNEVVVELLRTVVPSLMIGC